MKLFPDCITKCHICALGGHCLAGNGDDNYSPASKEKVIGNLDHGYYPSDKNRMIRYLKDVYGYEYPLENYGTKGEVKKPKINQDAIGKVVDEYTKALLKDGAEILDNISEKDRKEYKEKFEKHFARIERG